MAEELKACPFCGGAVRFHSDEDCHGCHYIECSGGKAMFDFSLTTDPENQCDSLHDLQCGIAHTWNTRAQLPSQGGEAVDVAAYIDDGGALYTSKLLEIMSVESDGCEPLMTVAQHNHIMADVRANRDAVLKVMRAKEMLPKCEDAPQSTDAEILDNYARMFEEEAERNAELVELLRSKFPRIDPCKPVPLDEKAHCCEYTIYVERERLHRLIDAKLASLKP